MDIQTTMDLVKEECLALAKAVGPMLPTYLRYLAFLLPVWLTGCFGFSFLWVLLGFCAFMMRQRDRLRHRRQDALHSTAALCDVKSLVDCIPDPPSWLYFPKRERVEWLNKIIKQIWPFIDDYVQAFIEDEATQRMIQDTTTAYR